ncbi:MAG: signal peptidase I [Treponema sp.]|jgi:signal peptidase I|nr:signal peptidase I [Treponema sp.]
MGKSGGHAAVFFGVVLASLLIKLFVFDIRLVSGSSMSPALQDGALVAEFKLAWGIHLPLRNNYLVRWSEPRPGDVVIYPWNGRYVIKRCVATAGTALVFSEKPEYSVHIGELTIPLTREQYIKMKNAERVPEGMIFALGDNMTESRDSRHYGFVSIDSIRGKLVWQ